MASREQTELENLALAGELARQLCHDFSNFLYSFFLQLEISRSKPGDWDAVKAEADKILRRLRQWDRFHRRFAFEESTVDLNQLIRKIAGDVSSQRGRVKLGPGVSGESFSIGTAARDCARLLRLLIEDTFDGWEAAEATPSVSLDLRPAEGMVTLGIVALGPSDASLPQDESLLAATCQSLAVRLGAVIRRIEPEKGRQIIEVDFPCEMMTSLH